MKFYNKKHASARLLSWHAFSAVGSQIGLLTVLALSSMLPTTQAVECMIYLNPPSPPLFPTNSPIPVPPSNNCSSIPSTIITVTPSVYQNVNQAVVKITLNPVVAPVYTKAIFTVYYGATPTGWSVNIGDSVTNDGWSGDYGTQSNDAEIEVNGSELHVYGNDYTPPPPERRQLLYVPNFVASGGTAILTVSDGHVGWQSLTTEGAINSAYLYALRGEPDSEGVVPNYNIYAAFNRVIYGNRPGTGVSWVRITLL